MKEIYELTDVTDFETYWTLGLFEHLYQVLAFVRENKTNPFVISPNADTDLIKVEIRRRVLGPSAELGRTVVKIEWELTLNEDLDEDRWVYRETMIDHDDKD